MKSLIKTQRKEQEQELTLNSFRKAQARAHQYELSQAKLQAQLNETLAEIAAEDCNAGNEQASIDAKPTNLISTSFSRNVSSSGACDNAIAPIVSDVRPTNVTITGMSKIVNSSDNCENGVVPIISNARPNLRNDNTVSYSGVTAKNIVTPANATTNMLSGISAIVNAAGNQPINHT